MTPTTEELRALRDRATKGPWSVMQPPNWIVDSRGMDLAHIRGWGFLTGHGHKDGGMDHKLAGEQMDANAALIALAPDLLDEVILLRADLAHEVEAHGETQAALREFMADVERLRADATEAALQYRQMTEKVTALRDALGDLMRFEKSITNDISSAHSNRGDGASSWMRDDDRDMRAGLSRAFDTARTALEAKP